jgi:hypothetical protein
MFFVEFDSARNVLLARFADMLVPDDIRGLDEAVRQFVSDHGPVPTVLDFSDISIVAVPESFSMKRSHVPLIFLGKQRVFVAARDDVLALARRYADQHREYGNPVPAIVPTMTEAYAILNIEAAQSATVPASYP